MKVVIGYGARGPVVVTRPEDAERLVWNNHCLTNLTAYLKRKEIKAPGQGGGSGQAVRREVAGGAGKGIADRAQEMHVIGMACEGVGEPKCAPAASHAALCGRDLGAAELPSASQPCAESLGRVDGDAAGRAHGVLGGTVRALREVLRLPPGLPHVLLRAVHRGQEPAHRHRPCAEHKGNFAWQIARAFHLAGRCVGCGECSRACPAGIDLALLNIVAAQGGAREFRLRSRRGPARQSR